MGFCGPEASDGFWDFDNQDFFLCFEDVFLFGIAFLFLTIFGTKQIIESLQKTNKRPYFRVRAIEWVIYVLSAFMVMTPVAIEAALVAQNSLALYEYVSLLLRTIGWAYSIVILHVEISRLQFTPSFVLYGWWWLSVTATSFRLRTALRLKNHELTDDFGYIAWIIQFCLVTLIALITLFTPRRTSIPHQEETRLRPGPTYATIPPSTSINMNMMNGGTAHSMTTFYTQPMTHIGKSSDASLSGTSTGVGVDMKMAEDVHHRTGQNGHGTTRGFDLESRVSESDMGEEFLPYPNTEGTASLYSILTFSWISYLISLGRRRQIQYSDLPDLLPFDRGEYCHKQFLHNWTSISNRLGAYDTDVSLFHTLRRSIPSQFYNAGVMQLIYIAMVFAGPQLLKLLITFATDFTSDDPPPLWKGFLLAGVLMLNAFAQTLLLYQYVHKVIRVGLWVKSALVTAIYEKTLRLSVAARHQMVGNVENLMSVDVQRMQGTVGNLHVLWSAPVQCAIGLWFIWQEVGYSTLVGLGMMLLVGIPINIWITHKLQVVRFKLDRLRTKRLKETTQALSYIKLLKMYAWETRFGDKISQYRKLELQTLKSFVFVQACHTFFYHCTPVLTSLSTFATFTLLEGEMTAAKGFVTLLLFHIVRQPLNQFPTTLDNIIRAGVSLRRLQNYLCLGERGEQMSCKWDTKLNESDETLVMTRATYYWDDLTNRKAIDNVTLRIKTGDLCCIVGKPGSGKTALLSTIIGELNKEEGQVLVRGDLCYAPQIPWIQHKSVRENILFGEPYDQTRYDHVLFACGLNSDISMFPDGDETEIGDKGISLSVGQKQRVSLARAVYHSTRPSTAFLFDDPVSAVRPDLARYIMKQVIFGILRNKTRILVVNSTEYLRQADLICVMERGALTYQGTYEELRNSGVRFSAHVNVNFQHVEPGPHKKDEERRHDPGAREDPHHSYEVEMRELDQKPVEEKDDFGGPSSADESSDGESVPSSPTHSLLSGESQSTFDYSLDSKQSDVPDRLNVEAISGQRSNGSQTSHPPKALRAGMLTGENQFEDKRRIAGSVVSIEKRPTETAELKVYAQYLNDAGGAFLVVCVVSAMILRCLGDIGANRWLGFWGDEVTLSKKASIGQDEDHDSFYFLGIYAALSGVMIIFSLLNLAIIGFGQLTASNKIHNGVLSSVLHAPLRFFEVNSISELINRFANDLYIIDKQLPRTLFLWLNAVFAVFAILGVVVAVTPYFLVACLPLFIAYKLTETYYIKSSRDLQRWHTLLRSPLFVHYTETVEGISTIRAFGKDQHFRELNLEKLNSHLISYYALVSANRWLAVRLEIMGSFVMALAAVLAVISVGNGDIGGGMMGLSIFYAVGLTPSLNWLVNRTSDREMNIIAAERLRQYSQTFCEEAWHVEDQKPDSAWPSRGKIMFNAVKFRHRPDLELALDEFEIVIEPGEKVALVGRPNAGKSSVFSAILRSSEVARGSIIIDDINIRNIGLHDLRKVITLVSQDSVLFSGTIRFNLDPFGHSSDDDMWKALKMAQLENYVHSLTPPDGRSGLDYEIQDGGAILRPSHRQQICLARAFLRRPKILLLDRATSAVDSLTNRQIFKSISKSFRNRTVLFITDSLEVILAATRVLVLEDGHIIEADRPTSLKNNKHSLFYSHFRDFLGD